MFEEIKCSLNISFCLILSESVCFLIILVHLFQNNLKTSIFTQLSVALGLVCTVAPVWKSLAVLHSTDVEM